MVGVATLMDHLRFLPDTWFEALMRYLAMAAPDANVYVEIPAPDLRFAALLFAALAALLCWHRLGRERRAVFALLVFVLAGSAVWLLTTGNGRYVIPLLLVAGPLSVGLICLLPLSRSVRATAAGLLLVGQFFVLHQQPPWGAWGFLQWGDRSYFPVERPNTESDGRPVTYVTISVISYSLIAPQFPPESRWLNLASVSPGRRDSPWAQDFLRQAPGPIKLLAPTIAGQLQPDGTPVEPLRKALDRLLAPHGLALDPADPCQLLRWAGREGMAKRSDEDRLRAPMGFWLCSLEYPVPFVPEQQQPLPVGTAQVLARVEQMCPRFFRDGSAVMRIESGALRYYPSADMRVYVLDDGRVLYKFWRALNPQLIGTVEEILAGKGKLDCTNIRGRSGLPWEREI